MTDWEGRVYRDERFREDVHYDQEFGKPMEDDRDSSFQRSRSTHFKNTVEHEDGTESYLQISPQKARTFADSDRSSSSRSRHKKSPNRSQEKPKIKPKKSLWDGKDLGREVKRELANVALLKLGTKLDDPKSLFHFWKNQIKERPKKKKNVSIMSISNSMQKPPRPATADNKSVTGNINNI